MGFLEEEWRYEPKKIIDDVLSVSISANQTKPFAAVIKTDHSLWTWGWNDEGQLGNGGKGIPLNGKDYEIFQLKPQKIMDNVAAVSCGFSHAAAIKMDGSLWMWGSSQSGQLGNEKSNGWDIEKTPIKIMDNVTAAVVALVVLPQLKQMDPCGCGEAIATIALTMAVLEMSRCRQVRWDILKHIVKPFQ